MVLYVTNGNRMSEKKKKMHCSVYFLGPSAITAQTQIVPNQL
jgi:hypothetical protein